MGVKGLVVSERDQILVSEPAFIPASTTCDDFVRILFVHRPALGFLPGELMSVQRCCVGNGGGFVGVAVEMTLTDNFTQSPHLESK